MDSIYFTDPLGLLIELAAYRFEPPHGFTHAEVLLEAHRLRVERGDHNIAQVHLADAIEDSCAAASRCQTNSAATLPSPRAISSAGRAPARQAGGHWFEPSIAHLTKPPQPRAFRVSAALWG